MRRLATTDYSALLDVLDRLPDPRCRRGIRHRLPVVLAVGIAEVLAGARSFAAIGEWAADTHADVLAGLGVRHGRVPDEATFRRIFARVDADQLDRLIGAWMWTRTTSIEGRRVIAIDGKTVRGARTRDRAAPHLVAALDHGSGTVLGQVAVAAKSNEIPSIQAI